VNWFAINESGTFHYFQNGIIYLRFYFEVLRFGIHHLDWAHQRFFRIKNPLTCSQVLTIGPPVIQAGPSERGAKIVKYR
jgi:hypothetical protein